jgi:hypothetical protein
MVLLDARGNASRTADAERIRRWIDPSWEPAKSKAAMRIKAIGQRVRKTFSRAQATQPAA